MTKTPTKTLRVHGRIAIDSRVYGRNHFTDEWVSGVVASLTRSDLDGKVYATVRQHGGDTEVMASDLRPERNRCRRPVTIPDARHTGGQRQGSGYRCANCGQTIWFIRDGWSANGERLTHSAVLSESPSHAF